MKPIYILKSIPISVIVFVLFSMALPQNLYSQCNCGGNSTPDQVVYNISTQTSKDSTFFKFPQFDATLGNLNCVELDINVISRVRIRLENDELFPVTYNIQYSKSTNFEGEGISGTLAGNFSKNYGPYWLDESDGDVFNGPDFIITPFDTMINTNIYNVINGNVTPFMGIDSVSYVYYISVASLISGSGNYLGGPQTIDEISFTLTYNYCIPGVLGNIFKSFSIDKANNNAVLNWTVGDELPNSEYTVEISYDNKQFLPAGAVSGNATPGSVGYQFSYLLSQASSPVVYFRIVRKAADGSIQYSAVRSVKNDHASGNLTTFPNPAKNNFSIHLPGHAKGMYLIEVFNSSGSLVHREPVVMEGNSHTGIRPAKNLPNGLYMIRARKENSPEIHTGKLFIKN